RPAPGPARLHRRRGRGPPPAGAGPPRRDAALQPGPRRWRGGRPAVAHRRRGVPRARLAPGSRRGSPDAPPAADGRAAAQVLEPGAAFHGRRGGSPFRICAFRTAAKALAGVGGDLRTALAEGALAATKGVGPATLQIVQEVADTGRSSLLE